MMMWVFLGLLPSLCIGSDLSVIQQRVIESQGSCQSSEASKWATTLLPNGTWGDINYADKNRVTWIPAEHPSRILTMAICWFHTGRNKQSQLLLSSQKAVNWWNEHHPVCPNWWFNQIGIPLKYGPACNALQEGLSEELQRGCVEVLKAAEIGSWTGENLIWEGEGMLFRGLLEGNETLIRYVFGKLFEEVKVESGGQDGIKVDGSFYQHGHQLMNGAYGSDFVSSIGEVLTWTVNTTFLPSEAQLQTFTSYILNGSQWMISYGLHEFGIIPSGRAITRHHGNHLDWSTDVLRKIPTPNPTEIQTLCDRIDTKKNTPPLIGHRHYWMTDYAVHRRPNWWVELKMYSKRTNNAECVNEEGKKSLHMSDGALFIYQPNPGHQYNDIFPVWNWDQIPGTSVEQGLVKLECSTVKQVGKTTFVGGASDGVYGIAAFDFAAALTGTLKGKKAWAFFNGAVVALGSGFHSTSSSPVYTTLAQRLVSGPLYHNNTNTPIPPGSSHTFSLNTQSNWLHHNDIGYYVPVSSGNTLSTSLEHRHGNWSSIGMATGSVALDVFTTFIHHKTTYEYILIPGISAINFESSVQKIQQQYITLRNTEEIQAVWSSIDQVLVVVYWVPGSVTVPGGNLVVEVRVPCVVTVAAGLSGEGMEGEDLHVWKQTDAGNNREGKLRVSVSDPSHSLIGEGHLVINGKLISFNWPLQDYAGRSVVLYV